MASSLVTSRNGVKRDGEKGTDIPIRTTATSPME